MQHVKNIAPASLVTLQGHFLRFIDIDAQLSKWAARLPRAERPRPQFCAGAFSGAAKVCKPPQVLIDHVRFGLLSNYYRP